MSFKVRDPVFTSLGEPGIVKKIDPETQKLSVETDQKAVQKEFRHGYLRGMNETIRSEFNSFMDELAALEDPSEKVSKIQEKILDLETNFSPKNYILLNYLNSELAHLKNTYHFEPRLYTAKADNLY